MTLAKKYCGHFNSLSPDKPTVPPMCMTEIAVKSSLCPSLKIRVSPC